MTPAQRRSSKAAFHLNRCQRRLGRKAYRRYRKRLGPTVRCFMDGPHMSEPLETPFPPSQYIERHTEDYPQSQAEQAGEEPAPFTKHVYKLQYMVHRTDGWVAYYKHVT